MPKLWGGVLDPSLYQSKYYFILSKLILLAQLQKDKTNCCYQLFVHITQKIVQCILYRDLPNDILDCKVQLCGFPALDVVGMEQSIPREMWVKWDGLQATQEQPEQAVSTIVNYDSDSTCDLEEVMNLCYENSNHSDNIPSSIDEVIESITPIAWLDNPLPRPQHVVSDNYTPASPVYSPEPIQVDTDEEEESRVSISPAHLMSP